MREPTTASQPSERENQVSRLFHAPRERVFHFFTDPARAADVFSRDARRVTIETLDFRVGGRFSILIREADGSSNRLSGEYREIVPPRLVVNTFEVSALPGVLAVETDEFEEVGAFTRLTVRWKFSNREDRDKMYGPEFVRTVTEGWDHVADLLGSD